MAEAVYAELAYADVRSRLEAVEPLRLQAIALVLRLEQTAEDNSELAERVAEIDAAITELNDHSNKVQELRKRCSLLSPIPSKNPVPGF